MIRNDWFPTYALLMALPTALVIVAIFCEMLVEQLRSRRRARKDRAA